MTTKQFERSRKLIHVKWFSFFFKENPVHPRYRIKVMIESKWDIYNISHDNIIFIQGDFH